MNFQNRGDETSLVGHKQHLKKNVIQNINALGEAGW